MSFLCVLAPAVAQAQGLPPCAIPAIATRAGLVAALDTLPRAAGGTELRAAAIASLGQPVVGWALEIAADSSGGSPAARRAAALAVLRFARWKPALPALIALAQPLRGDWVVWQGSLIALAAYPYIELQPFWSDLLMFPRRVVREQALRGIALVGDTHDLLTIGETTHRDRDAAMQALVEEVSAKLRRPLAERDTARFAWPPDSLGGRFVPSAGFLRTAVPVLCGPVSGARPGGR